MITADFSYEPAEGYESAKMKFNGNDTVKLWIISAENNEEEDGVGEGRKGIMGVTPAGTLPKNTNGAVIGAVTVTISAGW